MRGAAGVAVQEVESNEHLERNRFNAADFPSTAVVLPPVRFYVVDTSADVSGVDEPRAPRTARCCCPVSSTQAPVLEGLLEVGLGAPGGTLSTVVQHRCPARSWRPSIPRRSRGLAAARPRPGATSPTTARHRPVRSCTDRRVAVGVEDGAASGTTSARKSPPSSPDVEFLTEGDHRPVVRSDAGERRDVFAGGLGKLDHGDAISGADQFCGDNRPDGSIASISPDRPSTAAAVVTPRPSAPIGVTRASSARPRPSAPAVRRSSRR